MNQVIILALIGIVFFLMHITLYLSEIQEDITETRNLLSGQKTKEDKA